MITMSLTDFFKLVFMTRSVNKVTTAPTKDILVSSGALDFPSLGNDAEKDSELMIALNTKVSMNWQTFWYRWDLFAAEYATEAETAAEIKRVYEADSLTLRILIQRLLQQFIKYQAATGDATKTVIASTASPYKFPSGCGGSCNWTIRT